MITEGQQNRYRILVYVAGFIEEKGYSPSIREIMNGVDLKSTSTVKHHLDVLKTQGYLTFIDSLPRTLRMLEKEMKLN
jgi:SOS-response transcriptional repressor LexA